VDLKQTIANLVEAITAEVTSKYELVLSDLQTRVLNLESLNRVPPQECEGKEAEPKEPQTSIKTSKLKFARFIVNTLLLDHNEGKDLKTLVEIIRVEFPDKSIGTRATQTILDSLVESRLVKITRLRNSNTYNVPKSKVRDARRWTEKYTHPEEKVEPPVDSVEEPPIGLLSSSNGVFTLTILGEVLTNNRARALKKYAESRGVYWEWETKELAKKYLGRDCNLPDPRH
jgi:hypothetical protein